MIAEVWKDVTNYEGIYQVSNTGKVKRILPNGKERLLRGKKDKDGYTEIILSKKQKKAYFRLHRLVAKAFIPNPENKPEVNHKDKNKQNNSVCNLEWATTVENIRHSFALGRKVSTTPVLQFSANGELLAYFDSIKEAAQTANVKQSNISACCNSRLKTVGGYIWRYKAGVSI